jgi:hypothetical protein
VRKLLRNRWKIAWGALTGAFALHVLDEATHDFLAWYNPSALALRERLGGLPLPPIFSFPVWLTGLCAAVVILAALTPLIRSDRRWAVVFAYVYGSVHLLNAIGHITASVTGRWFAPGVLSSPILLICAAWLLYETWRLPRQRVSASLPVELSE